MDGREIKLKRLLGGSKVVIIAMDHCLFDGPIPGLEDLPATSEKINPIVNGVLLAPGMIRRCSKLFAGAHRPLAVTRLNWNTIYCFGLKYRDAVSVNSYQPEDALREGMDIALVSLTFQTGSEKRDAENVENFSRLTNRCHELGIPVIGEYFPLAHTEMTPEQLHKDVLIGSRIVAELGADAIKTFNTCDFSAVTGSCPVPVFGLGAEKLATQRDALELAASEIATGAGGVVFGRNALQVENPHAFQAALCDVVKEGASVDSVITKHELS